MRIDSPLAKATFIRRNSRFSALVRIGRFEELVHVPNSGRMRELLVPGRSVVLSDRHAPHRKTRYDMIMVRLGRRLVSIDSRIPAKLVRQAVEKNRLLEFAGYDRAVPEVPCGNSRLDLLLTRGHDRCLIEVKSVTLVEEQRGRFPDAPTLRGRRHLEALIRAQETGARAAVIFVVQRDDAAVFAPNDRTDPEFGSTLRAAAERGVEAYAYACRVLTMDIWLKSPLPVTLDEPGMIATSDPKK